ncbi:MAG: Ig-like domain-containing protein [Oligoflexia bacterium]|nr:Ig-like domain-containing protein [Oligoflexia bacterium]
MKTKKILILILTFLFTIILPTIFLSSCGVDKIFEKATSSVLFGSGTVAANSVTSSGNSGTTGTTGTTETTGSEGVVDLSSCSSDPNDSCHNNSNALLGVSFDPLNGEDNIPTDIKISVDFTNITMTISEAQTNIFLLQKNVSTSNVVTYSKVNTTIFANGSTSKSFSLTATSELKTSNIYVIIVDTLKRGATMSQYFASSISDSDLTSLKALAGVASASFKTASTSSGSGGGGSGSGSQETKTKQFEISNIFPANSAINIDSNSIINFTINKSGVANSTMISNIVLIKASDYNSGNYSNIVSGNISSITSTSGNSQTFTFTPTSKLADGQTEYIFAINRYLTGAVASDFDYKISFKTKASSIIDTKTLQFEVSNIVPTNNSENVELTSTINFTINNIKTTNAISTTTMSSNIVLIKASDYAAGDVSKIITGSLSLSASTTGSTGQPTTQTFTFTPSSKLEGGQTQYLFAVNRYLTVANGASAAAVAAVVADFDYKISFKTKATVRSTEFEVVSIQPANDATNVEVNSAITFTINKTNIIVADLLSNIVLIKESDLLASNYNPVYGKLVSGAVPTNGSNQSFTFTPEVSLVGQTKYVFAMNRYLTGQSTANDFDYRITFTTKVSTQLDTFEYIPCPNFPAQGGSARTKLYYNQGVYYASVVVSSTNPADHTFNSPLISNRQYETMDNRHCVFTVINNFDGKQIIVQEGLNPTYKNLLDLMNTNN